MTPLFSPPSHPIVRCRLVCDAAGGLGGECSPTGVLLFVLPVRGNRASRPRTPTKTPETTWAWSPSFEVFAKHLRFPRSSSVTQWKTDNAPIGDSVINPSEVHCRWPRWSVLVCALHGPVGPRAPPTGTSCQDGVYSSRKTAVAVCVQFALPVRPTPLNHQVSGGERCRVPRGVGQKRTLARRDRGGSWGLFRRGNGATVFRMGNLGA